MSNSIGDGYITEDTGHLWGWDGSAYVDCGKIVGPPGPSSAVQDEGTVLPQRMYINFVGDGIAATDDAANNRTIVTVLQSSQTGAGQFLGKVVIGVSLSSFTDPLTGTVFTWDATHLVISNIPQNFTGIAIKFFGGASGNLQQMGMAFNGDTNPANYPWMFLQCFSNSPFINAGPAQGGEFGPVAAGSNYATNIDFEVLGYACHNWFKQYVSTADSGANILGFANTPQRQVSQGAWLSGANITSITITYVGLLSQSTFSVSGIL